MAPPTSVVDAGPDTFVPSPVVDAGAPDVIDGGDAAPVCVPRAATGRAKLSETGLYEDIATKTIACDLTPFEPEFALWSDAAEKKRWVRLPAGTEIDESDPDHWRLPVGGQLFKEFSLGGKRLETRLIEHIANTGVDSADYFYGAFLWRDDESDADFVVAGASNVRGTPHDVPSAAQCFTCHVGEPGRALGFSAVQLSKGFPGNATERAALGYLHANCGHCHNQNGSAWPDTQMVLRIGFGEKNVAETKLFASTVGIDLQSFSAPGITKRIAPGDPDASCVAFRPTQRGDAGAMPPIATETVDDAGVAVVSAWIASLDAGAP